MFPYESKISLLTITRSPGGRQAPEAVQREWRAQLGLARHCEHKFRGHFGRLTSHDIRQQFIPGVFSTHSVLRDRQFGYNVEETATFLQDADIMCRQQHWASVAEQKGAAEGKADPAAQEEVACAPVETKKEKAAGLKEESRKATTPAQGQKETRKLNAASTSAKETAPKIDQGKKV